MINMHIVVGRLGADPKTQELNSGTKLTKFPVATSETYTDKNGERQEKTAWHNCEAWGKLAEICDKYLKKGKLVYISGSTSTDKVENGDEVRYYTKLTVREMKMLDKKDDSSGNQNSSNDSGPVDDDDEIPF